MFSFAINVALFLMCWAPLLSAVSYSVSHGNGQKDRTQGTKFKWKCDAEEKNQGSLLKTFSIEEARSTRCHFNTVKTFTFLIIGLK